MIKEINKNNIKEILILQQNFPNIFLKCDILNDFNNNPYTKYLVYVINANVVGFINYYLIYDKIEIVNFNILENYQNQHIGSSLLQYILDLAKQKKIVNITLEVRKDNLKAIHLYHKYGFVDKAIRKKYYNDVDGILMEKELI